MLDKLYSVDVKPPSAIVVSGGGGGGADITGGAISTTGACSTAITSFSTGTASAGITCAALCMIFLCGITGLGVSSAWDSVVVVITVCVELSVIEYALLFWLTVE